MKLKEIQRNINKIGIFFITTLFLSACNDSEDVNDAINDNNSSENIVDASAITLLQSSTFSKSNLVTQQNTVAEAGVFNSTGEFLFPTESTEFSGNVSVSINVEDEDGINRIFLGFEGSNLVLPICEDSCSNQFSAFVTAINPTLFDLSSGQQEITLWVEDNDDNVSKVNTLIINWDQLVINDVTASIDNTTEQLTVSWNSLPNTLRYNVYLSTNEVLTTQNYTELTDVEARLALTSTSVTYSDKTTDSTHYILVTAVDGSGESAFSDVVILSDDVITPTEPLNNPPTITSKAPTTATEGVLYSYIPSVSDEDDSNNGVDLTWSLTNAPAGMTVSSTGTVTWTPSEGQVSSGNVTLTVADGGENNVPPATETFIIAVTTINDAPVITSKAPTTATEGVLYSYTPSVSDNDDSNNGVDLTWSLTNAPAGMTVSSTGTVTWTPSEGQVSSGNVTLTVADGGENNAVPATETFVITVTTVNDAPVITSKAPTTATEDILYTYTPSVSDEDDSNNGVDLTWSLTNAPVGMAVSSTGTVTWTPSEGQVSSGNVTLTVADGGENNVPPATETFIIVVTTINDAPVITSKASTTATEDILYTYTPSVSDEDDSNNGVDLTWSLTNAPVGMAVSSTGTVTWTPSEGQVSSGNVTLTVADGGENNAVPATETFVITVTTVNDAPVITSKAPTTATEDILYTYTPSISDNDDSNNGVDLTWSLTNAPVGMAVSSTGTVTWTPSEGQVSSGNVTLTVADGGENNVPPATETFVITVTTVNDAPVITSKAPTTATEDILYTYTPSVSDNDDSNNGVDLTWSLTNAPVGMEVSSTGTVTWTPSEGQLSSGDVTISVTDAGENNVPPATETFIITVTAVNDAPVFVDGNAVTVYIDENSPVNTEVYMLVANDPDAGAELTYNLPNGDGVFQLESKAGSLYVSNASILDYESKSSYVFNITVADEWSLSDTITVTINVNDVIENTSYALDTSFTDNGISDFNTYADTEYNDLLVDAVLDDENNRYLLSYSDKLDSGSNDYTYTLSKLNQDGTFDLAFADNGRKYINITNLDDPNVTEFDDSSTISSFKPTRIKVDNINNKIYLLGYQDDGSSAKEAFWLRLTSDGSIDSTFDNDGKLVQTSSSNDIQAVDLVTHSNGYIYLASSSLETSAVTKTFILSKFDEQNSATTFVAHNFLSSSSSEQYIIGLIENTVGDLVALGYATVNEDTNVIAASIDPDEITKVLTAVELEFASNEDDPNKVHTNTLSTYSVIDNSTVLLGGLSDDLASSNYDILIAKLNVDSLTLDTSFGGGDGFYTNDKGVNNENIISLDVGSDGNITYINKVKLDSNTYKLFPYQLDSSGVITTQLADTSEDEELAGTSDNLDQGVTDANINAVVLIEPSDSTNTVYIFSNIEKENYNGLSTPELINTELEIYYEKITSDSTITEFGVSANRIDYEFQMANSLAVDSKLLHSSGKIITITPRYNDSGTGDIPNAEGHTITRHDLTTGLLNQEQNSLVHRNGYSDNYIKRHSTQLVALAETDSNGDNYLFSAEIIADNSIATLRATKFSIDGVISEGFPVDLELPDNAYFESNAYNTTANRVALFGGYSDNSVDENNSLLVTLDIECLTINDDSCQAINVQEFLTTTGLTIGQNRLTSGVVQNDGSVISIGFGTISNNPLFEDTFLVKVEFDDSLNGTIDSDFDKSANDNTDDDILTVEIDSSNDIHSGKLAQLSDSSLVYFATQTESNSQSYLVRLIDSSLTDNTLSGQQYKIDVSFDDITASSTEVDGTILLNMDSLSSTDPLGIEVKDFAINSKDEIILVGNVNPSGGNAGFIAKFNGLNGEPDSLLAKNSLSGYYIPNGDAQCAYLGGQGQEEICSILEYHRVSITTDGALIIHTRLQNADDSYNSAILKFKEQQNDNATSYSIF